MSNGGNIPEYKVPKEYPYGGLPKNEPYANPAIPIVGNGNPSPRIETNDGSGIGQSSGSPVSGRVPVDRIVNPY